MRYAVLAVTVLSVLTTEGCGTKANSSSSNPPQCQADTKIRTELIEPPPELAGIDRIKCAGPEKFASDSSPINLFFMGNSNGLPYNVNAVENHDLQKALLMLFSTASATRLRRACVLPGTEANLKAAAQVANLENIVWLGHGADGDLIDVDGNRIPTDNLPVFKSASLVRVTFVACQTGQKREQWRQIFANSPKVNFDISDENILVTKGEDYLLGKYADSIVSCSESTTGL